MPARRRCRSRSAAGGFTLVELLVVIGIVALLIGMVMPALGKARVAANRTRCLSNVRQITLAVLMYGGENRGKCPAVSRWNGTATLAGSLENDADFVYWEQPAKYWFRPAEQAPAVPVNLQDDANRGTLVRLMGRSFSPAVWVCPDDDPRTHRIVNGTTDLRYPYSYTMNYFFDAGLSVNNAAWQWIGSAPMKMARVRTSSACIVVLEEGSSTINDGCTITQVISGTLPGPLTPSVTSGMDLAAVRHGSMGRPVHLPGTAMAVGDFDNIPNTEGMTNVGFCDGHAATVTRDFVHSSTLRHWDPTR